MYLKRGKIVLGKQSHHFHAKELNHFQLSDNLGVIRGPGSKWALSGFSSPLSSFPFVSQTQSQYGVLVMERLIPE